MVGGPNTVITTWASPSVAFYYTAFHQVRLSRLSSIEIRTAFATICEPKVLRENFTWTAMRVLRAIIRLNAPSMHVGRFHVLCGIWLYIVSVIMRTYLTTLRTKSQSWGLFFSLWMTSSIEYMTSFRPRLKRLQTHSSGCNWKKNMQSMDIQWNWT